MTTETAPAVMEQGTTPVTIGFNDSASFELTQRAAKLFASSSLVPSSFQGNLANCAIAVNMAHRIGADELMVMQNLYIVHGRPGWSSQFLIATFNNNPKFSALRYEFKGEEGTDDWGCRAWAIETETGEKLYGSWITIGLAKSEGWFSKKGSKWQTMPQQMLMYRAASWFIRAYAPEIAMGLHTAEELRETIDVTPGNDGTYQMDEQPPAVDLDALWNTLLKKVGIDSQDEEKLFSQFVDLTAESNGCTMEDLLSSAYDQSEEFMKAFENWKAKNAPQEEPTEDKQPETKAADPTDEVAVAKEVLGDDAKAYVDAKGPERKKKLTSYLQAFSATVQDAEKKVGKGYSQWTGKDRAVLLNAYRELAQGADPADVFPTN